MSLEQLAGIVVVGLAAILMLAFAFLWRKYFNNVSLRSIPAMIRLRKSIGLTIEDGKRLHVSLGNAGILSPGNAASLIGFSALERMALLSMISDRPPIVTSGEGSLLLLSQDTLRYIYRKGNVLSQYDPLRARLSGVTPFSYAVGAMPSISQENVLTSVLIGRFGPEVALLNDAANQNAIYSFSASDDLTAQAVMFATAQDPLVGEELFAIPAYLKAGPFHQSSLLVQDILRWILIAIMLGGVALLILEQAFGIVLL